MAAADRALETALKRDRLIVLTGLAAVVLLAAAYTLRGVGMPMSALTMTRMAIETPYMMMTPMAWSPTYALLVFLMWWIMMTAMMVPSAAPMLLLHAGLERKRHAGRPPYAATGAFLAGYLVVWAGFSAAATALQWALASAGAVTGMMAIASGPVAAAVLIAAGLYQFTPLKDACLRHCQHPLMFLLHHWKPGTTGAFRMGAGHGRFCLGCCWFLMALLFVGGVMNLIWIAGLAIYVALEKLAAGRRWPTTALGLALVAAGVIVLAQDRLA
jgi:predicted metal-binding membrane protein